jgi:hypothetical protein
MSDRRITFVAAIWTWDREERCHRRMGPIFNLGSNREHAKDRAESLLPIKTYETTRHNVARDGRSLPFVVIEECHGDRKSRRLIKGRPIIVEPTAVLVPSCGDRGYA